MSRLREIPRTQAITRQGCGHLVHWAILLLPTIVLGGLSELNWHLFCLAGVFFFGALLESYTAPDDLTSSAQDPTALRVAWFVGPYLLATIWAAQIEHIVGRYNNSWLVGLGTSVLVIGFTLRVTAIRTLGHHFVSDVRTSGSYVRKGVYAWLRHPSEFGLLLIALGGPLVLSAPITAIAAIAILAPISCWRMRRENAAWRVRNGHATALHC